MSKGEPINKKRVLLLLLILGTACGYLGLQSWWKYRSISGDILFVGNSHVSVNDVPLHFRKLAASLGETVTTASIVGGGKHLSEHEYFAKIVMGNPTWKAVILQEQSFEPIQDFESYKDAYQVLSRAAHEHKIKVVSYAVFARPAGHRHYTRENISGPNEMTRLLLEAAQRAALDGDVVSPVGTAWLAASRDKDLPSLFYKGDYHASEPGAYLTACTLFASYFSRTPVGATYRPSSLSEVQAKRLQGHGWDAVQSPSHSIR